MLRPHLSHVLRQKTLMDGTVSLPEDDAAVPQSLVRIAAKFLVRIPHRHFFQTESQSVSRIAAEVLIGKKQDLVAIVREPIASRQTHWKMYKRRRHSVRRRP